MKPKRFEVRISLENDSFGIQPGQGREEIARILRNIACRVADFAADSYILRDVNGNTVGVAAFGKASYRRIK